MQFQQFIYVIVILFVVMFVYDLYRANTRILCRFTRRDKGIKKKWAKPKNGERVEFDNGWYYVVMKRILLDTMYFGLIPVKVLEFTYRSIYPRDPETGRTDEETPQERKNLDRREAIEAWNVGTQRAMGKSKVTVGGGWLPVMLIVGIVVIIYFMF